MYDLNLSHISSNPIPLFPASTKIKVVRFRVQLQPSALSFHKSILWKLKLGMDGARTQNNSFSKNFRRVLSPCYARTFFSILFFKKMLFLTNEYFSINYRMYVWWRVLNIARAHMEKKSTLDPPRKKSLFKNLKLLVFLVCARKNFPKFKFVIFWR